MGHGLRSATFLMCMSGRRVSLMILDGVAPASTTMAATLGMVASVAIAEVAEQGSWGAIRLIWMRLDRAGDSDRGRAPQTGITLHPLAIAPVVRAYIPSTAGRPRAQIWPPRLGRSRAAGRARPRLARTSGGLDLRPLRGHQLCSPNRVLPVRTRLLDAVPALAHSWRRSTLSSSGHSSRVCFTSWTTGVVHLRVWELVHTRRRQTTVPSAQS